MAETEEKLRRYFEEQVENTIPGYWDSWLMKQSLPQLKSREH
jgi:hypothetical protein